MVNKIGWKWVGVSRAIDVVLFFLGVGAFYLTIHPAIESHKLDQEWEYLAYGYLVMWVMIFITILNQQFRLEMNDRSAEAEIINSRELIERVMDRNERHVANILGLQHYNQVYMHHIDKLLELASNAEKNKHSQRYFDRQLVKFIDISKRNINGSPSDIYKPSEEIRRMHRLNYVIDDAKTYVYAVTYDFDDYLTTWSFNNSEYQQYIEKQRRRRDEIVIHRILILREGTREPKQPDSTDAKKRQEAERIVSGHKAAGIAIDVVPHEAILGAKLDMPEAGFLVSDDYVSSMSYHSGGINGQQDGWVSLNDQSEINNLLERFRKLQAMAISWP